MATVSCDTGVNPLLYRVTGIPHMDEARGACRLLNSSSVGGVGGVELSYGWTGLVLSVCLSVLLLWKQDL